MDIVLTTNSPGEVSGWVRPIVRQLARDWPEARVSLFVLPCAFASGQECAVASTIEGINHVFPVAEYWRLALLGKKPLGFNPSPQGLVLFLGGDQTHAVIIGRRLGYPVYVYTEGRALWPRAVSRYFVPYPDALGRVETVAPGRAELVGNLMLDAIRPQTERSQYRSRLGVKPGELLVALFPGSRPPEFRYVARFFREIAQEITRHRECRFVVSLSPFIPSELAAEVFDLAGTDLPIVQGEQYEIMQAADVAITIPGTNTAEMAFLGLPMVVTLPLDRPDLIPLEGLAGLVGRLPVVGRRITAYAVRRVALKMPFTALPNIIAGRYVTPELRGEITASEVAQDVLGLLQDTNRREKISRELREVIGSTGAAGRIIAALRKVYGQED